MARRAHGIGRLQDDVGERIPPLMAEAGLGHPTEVDHRVTILGRVTFYRAGSDGGTGPEP